MSTNKLNYVTDGDRTAVLGSGELYAIKHTTGMDYSTVTTENMTDLGYIQANATLKASVETVDIETANYGTIATLPKKKTVTFDTGIVEWNLKNVSDFLTGSSYSADETTGKKSFYYGDGDRSPDVMLRFVSEDESAKKRITVDMYKCNFNGDIEMAFSTSDPITFDYAFKVLSTTMPNGKNGYYFVSEETIA